MGKMFDTFKRALRSFSGGDRTIQADSSIVVTDDGLAVGDGSVGVRGNVYGDVTIGAILPTPPSGLREAYLNWLLEQVRNVPLSGVDPRSVCEESRRDLDLAAVYTALRTQRPEETQERSFAGEREVKRLSAVAVLNKERRLALLGDPGSGKSTFVNFVALCMAGELLHRSDANLAVLRTPIPDDEQERFEEKKTEEPQPWDHGTLLPLRVVLREFVVRGLAPMALRLTCVMPCGNLFRPNFRSPSAIMPSRYARNCSTLVACSYLMGWMKYPKPTTAASKSKLL